MRIQGETDVHDKKKFGSKTGDLAVIILHTAISSSRAITVTCDYYLLQISRFFTSHQ